MINCKVELKRKLKLNVLAAVGADNAPANSNNIIFTIKDTKLYVPVVTLSVKGNQNYQNFLAKDLKDQCLGMNVKQ